MILRQNNIPIKSMQQISLEKTGKPVAQCDKETGEIIKIYPSAKQAGREINGKYTHISEVANGKRKSAYGFCNNHVDVTCHTLLNHSIKLITLFCISSTYTIIRKYTT